MAEAPVRRRAPLVAPGREAPSVASAAAVEATPRPAWKVATVGIGAALGSAGLLYALAAGPIYILAQIATDGLQRPAFRTALAIALVVAGIGGVLIGAGSAVWWGRGGTLPSPDLSPTERSSIPDR